MARKLCWFARPSEIFQKWIDDFQAWFGARWLFLSRGRGVRGAERKVKKLGEAAESATV